MPSPHLTGIAALAMLLGSLAAAEGPSWTAVPADAYRGDLGPAFDPGKMHMGLVFADRVAGDAYLLGWGEGLLKSTDGGRTFIRVDDGQISGPQCGPASSYAAQISPLGGRIAVFNMFNGPGPSGYSLNGGVDWVEFAHAMHDRDWETGACDWESKAVLAVPHESSNGLYFSANGGRTWTMLDKPGGNQRVSNPEILGLGVLGAQTLLVGYVDRIERSDDAGRTWAKISDFGSVGQAAPFQGKVWWLTRPGNGRQCVLASGDGGRTWSAQGALFPAEMGDVWFGPMFGADAGHVVVAGTTGFFESTDGCKTWQRAAPLPAGVTMQFPASTAAWDPVHQVFYACCRGKALLRWQRAP